MTKIGFCANLRWQSNKFIISRMNAGEYDFQRSVTLKVGTADLVVESGYSAPTIADPALMFVTM